MCWECNKNPSSAPVRARPLAWLFVGGHWRPYNADIKNHLIERRMNMYQSNLQNIRQILKLKPACLLKLGLVYPTLILKVRQQ
jgi:hypothetical protein